LNKVEVEARALATIETFTIEGDCKLPPPPKEMLMNGLFALLSKTNMIMDKTLLQDPKVCLVISINMKTIRTLHKSLMAITTKKHNLFD
jgi:hypothetical protein